MKKIFMLLLVFLSQNVVANRLDHQDVASLLGYDVTNVEFLDIRNCGKGDIYVRKLCELAFNQMTEIDGWIVSLHKDSVYAHSRYRGKKRLKENYYLKKQDIFLKLGVAVSTLDSLKIEEQFFPDVKRLRVSGYASGDGKIEYRNTVVSFNFLGNKVERTVTHDYNIDITGDFESDIVIAYALNPNHFYDYVTDEYVATYQPKLRIFSEVLSSDIEVDVDSGGIPVIGNLTVFILDSLNVISNGLSGDFENSLGSTLTAILNLIIVADDLTNDSIFNEVSDFLDEIYDEEVESVFKSIEDKENSVISDLLDLDSNGLVEYRISGALVRGKAYAPFIPLLNML